MRHTFLFARHEGMRGLTAADVLVLRSYDPDATSHEEALRRFEMAVTEWLNTTEQGREAWHDSCEDFNIGDLLLLVDFMGDEFHAICHKYNIEVTGCDFLAWDQIVPYDKVLNLNPPDEAPEEDQENIL